MELIFVVFLGVFLFFVFLGPYKRWTIRKGPMSVNEKGKLVHEDMIRISFMGAVWAFISSAPFFRIRWKHTNTHISEHVIIKPKKVK